MEWMKLDISYLVCRLNVKSTGVTRVKVLQYGSAFRSHDLLKFREIRAIILSEMRQDRDIVTMED